MAAAGVSAAELRPWSSGSWLNPSDEVHEDGSDLVVAPGAGSDVWRLTSYGFTRDGGHALLVPLEQGAAVTGRSRTLRARSQDGPWRMLRLAPLDPAAAALAGPACCAPESPGLRVRFTRFALGAADPGLHEPPP